MIVLKIIGWILLSVLVLILLALCVKVKICAEYSDENTFVALKWLFLNIPLYPTEKKEIKEEEEKKDKKNKKDKKKKDEADASAPAEENETPIADIDEEANELPEEPGEAVITEAKPSDKPEEKKPDEKKKESLLHIIYRTNGIDGILLLLRRIFSYLGTFIGDLMKSLVVEEFYLDIRCSKKDAAETAIYYGEVCSAVFPLLGSLVTKYKVKKYDINVYPDFLAPLSSASFAITFHLVPMYLIGITIALAAKLIFKVVFRLFGKIFLSLKKDKTEK